MAAGQTEKVTTGEENVDEERAACQEGQRRREVYDSVLLLPACQETTPPPREFIHIRFIPC